MGFNYVVLRIADKGLERDIPIIYPDVLVHADVAAALERVPGLEKAVPVSAGNLILDVVSCSGRSSTLKLESRGDEDKSLINSFPYFHGIQP